MVHHHKHPLFIAPCLLHYVTYAPAKFEVATPYDLEMHLKGNTVFDIDLGIKVTRNIA